MTALRVISNRRLVNWAPLAQLLTAAQARACVECFSHVTRAHKGGACRKMDIDVIRPAQQIKTLFFRQSHAGMMVAEMAIAARDTQVSVHPDGSRCSLSPCVSWTYRAEGETRRIPRYAR